VGEVGSVGREGGVGGHCVRVVWRELCGAAQEPREEAQNDFFAP
jgi:hypothetical protein